MLTRLFASCQEFLDFLLSNRGGAALARGGIGSLAIKLLHAALTLAVAVLLARMLGPTQFGVYAFAFAVAAVLTIPIQFGLPLLVVRETAAARARSDASAIQGIWNWSMRFVFLGSAFAFTVASLALIASWGTLDSNLRWTLIWALPLAPLMAVAALHGAALRGFDRVVIGQFPDHVMRLAILLSTIIFAIAWSIDLTAPRAMAMHALSAILTLLAAHLLLKRFRPVTRHAIRVDQARSRRWMFATLPLGFIAAAQIINTRADTLLLGILSDAQSVGIYQVAVQGAQAVALSLGAINLVVAPRFAALYEQGDMERLQRLVTLSARVVVLLTIPVVVVIVLFGDSLIRWILGTEYQNAHLALVILAAGQLANAGFGAVAMLLNMTGHEHATARGLAISALLNIALNLALIPSFGLEGAAAATAISLIVWNFLLWHSTRRLVGINSLAFARMPRTTQRV